ncbi:protein toll [Cephus cinctus]|uniref:Protein toll n=1 Tax=Cephus cinctus TaxID=211228 RepID=A0AAJ7FG01_CEPCN|nr:protein toll [Cephus cinctus]
MDSLWRYFVILTLAVTSRAFQCPDSKSCSCQTSHYGDYEINCPMLNNSAFIINLQPNQYVQVQCLNSPSWSDFPRIASADTITEVDSMQFKMCNLPNSTLSEVAGKLGVSKIKSLIFQSYVNLSATFKRDHLKGFPNVTKLVLSSNSLTRLSSDFFNDFPELKWLDLRENNVQLPAGIFESVPKLELLELGNNMIEVIDPAVFRNLTKLKLLNLWKNKLTELKPDTFEKLISLESLDIHSNELTTLPLGIFSQLGNLTVLNLYRNNFSSFPEGLLSNNFNLRKFDLFDNRQNLTTLPKRFFSGLTRLKEVKLTRNRLDHLPEDIFWGASSMTNLSIERNFLTSLPERIFKDLKELGTLNLSFNELTTLPDGLFASTTKLYNLDLSKNHLTAISETLFSGLTSLEILNVQENNLMTIHEQAFNSLRNLNIARFSNNQLTLKSSFLMYEDEYGSRSPFHYCHSLKELYLAYNNISEMYGDWVISSPNLRLLDLKHNQLPSIETSDLQFTSRNIEVDLTYNNISHVFLANSELLAINQNTARNVKILLDKNPVLCDCVLYDLLRYLEGEMHPNVQNLFYIVPGDLKCKGPSWLEDIPVSNLNSKSLKCLVEGPDVAGKCPEKCECWVRPHDTAFLVNCSYRQLRDAPGSIEGFANHHVELNLTGNYLTEMPSFHNPGYKQVTTLLSSYNNISSISLEALSPDLKVLELHNNNLTYIDKEVLEFMSNSSLTKLTLHGNPWKCNCKARDFLTFVQTKFEEIPERWNITCAGTNKPIFKMTTNTLCPVATGMVVGISLTVALMGLVIGILAALYYRYQQEVKVWLYAHQLCLWFVTEDELDKDKLYDAFISYSHKDEDFVVNELVTKLEQGPTPYKLCIHFRDWLAGEWIPTQIARSVEESKRTLVILSPNFLESIWGRMEFRAAHSQALNDGRARVIVILYGDIGPTENLDPELKAYLSMNTYVKWGDPWFWDKLRYALPHPPELTKKKVRTKIFEKHQPTILLNGDKNELIRPVGAPETPPAITTPPADSMKTFVSNGSIKKPPMIDSFQKEPSMKNGSINTALIIDSKLSENLTKSPSYCGSNGTMTYV